jgi:YD repeat-containing protein
MVTRPAAELFGIHPVYGIAGNGVNSATGDYSRTSADLTFSLPLLDWARTYNSMDGGTGPFGQGWTPALSAHLVVGGNGTVSFHGDDGRVLAFTPADGGGFARPPDLDADLTHNADGTFALRYLDGDVWSFDSAGRGVSRTSRGLQLTFGYDDQQRLSTATLSSGQSLSLTYNTDGRIGSVAANDGRAVSYAFDPNGFLRSATGPNGLIEQYESASGLVGRVLDAEGRMIVTNGYGTDGRVTHQDYGPGGSADFAYDIDAGSLTVTGTGNVKAVYQHDGAGHLSAVTDPNGGTVKQTFDARGHVTQLTSAGGLTVDLGYDARGNVVSRAVSGAVTRYEYDDHDRLPR